MDLRTESLGELSGQVDNRRCYVGKIDRNKNLFHACSSRLAGASHYLKIVTEEPCGIQTIQSDYHELQVKLPASPARRNFRNAGSLRGHGRRGGSARR